MMAAEEEIVEQKVHVFQPGEHVRLTKKGQSFAEGGAKPMAQLWKQSPNGDHLVVDTKYIEGHQFLGFKSSCKKDGSDILWVCSALFYSA